MFITLIIRLAAAAPASKEGRAKEPPQSPSTLQSLADTALAKGDFKTAIQYYGKLIKALPSQLNYHKRASVYLKKKEYEKAISDLDKVILARQWS